jgi:hypothetical protein
VQAENLFSPERRWLPHRYLAAFSRDMDIGCPTLISLLFGEIGLGNAEPPSGTLPLAWVYFGISSKGVDTTAKAWNSSPKFILPNSAAKRQPGQFVIANLRSVICNLAPTLRDVIPSENAPPTRTPLLRLHGAFESRNLHFRVCSRPAPTI